MGGCLLDRKYSILNFKINNNFKLNMVFLNQIIPITHSPNAQTLDIF